MFDASEVLFLDVAVRIGVLTTGQRQRLIDYSRDGEIDMNVTDLVVEAGLMIQQEVAKVMEAIAGDVGGEALAESQAHYGSWDDAGDAVSADDLDSIIDGKKKEKSRPTDAHDALEVRARMTGKISKEAPPEEEWEYEDEEAPSPAFPMPGQAQASGDHRNNSAYGESHSAEEEEENYQTNAHWYASTRNEINDILSTPLHSNEEEEEEAYEH